jgi:UDP-glucose 4-epimerase
MLMTLGDDPRAVGEVFNVGSDYEIAIGELAETVKVLADSRSELVLVPYSGALSSSSDIQRRVPDLTKLRGLLGRLPSRSLEEIIDRVLAFHRRAVPCNSRASGSVIRSVQLNS